jgi:antitoxin MazE
MVPTMEAVLKKWGNSIGVRLPSPVLKEARLTQNQRVTISARKGAIVIKASKARQYSLAELVGGITRKNRHAAVEFGQPIGRELL